MGVGSSFQAGNPYPIYIEQGLGARLWDVDGNGYVDFHGGFGCNVVGHAHPKIVEAIDRAARTGTHFAATTEVTVAFAEELCRRFTSRRSASRTPAPKRRWTPSASREPRPGVTTS